MFQVSWLSFSNDQSTNSKNILSTQVNPVKGKHVKWDISSVPIDCFLKIAAEVWIPKRRKNERESDASEILEKSEMS